MTARGHLEDAKPIQSLKKAAAAPDGVRAFRLQAKGPALPDALRSLRNLEILVLRSTELTHFPTWLPELTALRALELGGCAPSLYTAAELSRLAALPRLEEILIDHPVPLRTPDAVARVPQLRRLRLRSTGLTAIPDAWQAFTELTALDLWGNQLDDLPDFLRDLPLTSLLLDNNQFRRLPAWLLASPRLTHLSVHDNRLTDLPSAGCDAMSVA